MAELTKRELSVIRSHFMNLMAWAMPRHLVEVQMELVRAGMEDGDKLIESLIKKKVLSLSPDGHMVRMTDYGAELYASMTDAQEGWERQEIVRVESRSSVRVTISRGEMLK